MGSPYTCLHCSWAFRDQVFKDHHEAVHRLIQRHIGSSDGHPLVPMFCKLEFANYEVMSKENGQCVGQIHEHSNVWSNNNNNNRFQH